MNRKSVTVAALLSALAPAPLLAHPFHLGDGLAAGLLHPFAGADHLLALVAVGLLASRYPGRRGVWLPGAFVAGTAAGFLAAASGVLAVVPEAGILATVICLGVLVAAPGLAAPAFAVAAIAVFGAVHGAVHALEASGAGLALGSGLVLATALLHAGGLAMGLGLRRARRGAWVRALGAAVVAASVAMPLLG